ncbi:hypothetical protein UlMin_029029 [Ulmus minor]
MVDLNTVSLSLIFLSILISILFLSSSKSHQPNTAPCPQSYPLIGNLPGFLLNRHRFHDWVAEMLSQTPSSTLRVSTFLNLSNGVCTANPLNVQHLLLSNFPNYVKSSRYQENLGELLGNGIFNVDGDLWTLQRKVASHEFNTRSLKNFISETVEFEISDRLIPILSCACDENRSIDLQLVLQKFGFDNICNVAFGVDPESLNSNRIDRSIVDLSFVEAFDSAVEICSSRLMSPLPLVWKTKRFLNIGSEKRFKEALQVINGFAMEIINSKEEQIQIENQDLLSRFISSCSNLEFEDQEQKRKFLRDIVISFILAGRDSTSTALTWFFWLISGHPRCANLIQKELSEARRTREPPLGENFGYDELKKLHYLQAAISESMRLFPPVPINSRLAMADDVWPDGTQVGKGWFADYSAYAMGRMEKIWGHDCLEYKPERWLNGDDKNLNFQPFDQFTFPVFHCGPRVCLGKEMAYVQMKSVVAAVMAEFEIVAVDGGASPEKMKNPPYVLSLLLKMRGGLLVRLKRRQQ